MEKTSNDIRPSCVRTRRRVRCLSRCIGNTLTFAATLALSSGALFATDYYVSNSGNDKNAGTSASKPWKTISRVNSGRYAPGDRILFSGGQSFGGKIYLAPGNSGTPSNPIAITSYGSSPAIIAAGSDTALYIYNNAGISISNLRFVGAGAGKNNGHGIMFYADLGGNTKLNFVRIDRVEVSGFGQDGIVIGAWNGATGFQDVRITNSSSHDNGDAGVAVWGATPIGAAGYPHRNVYVGRVQAYNNIGIPTKLDSSTGNGIVFGQVQNGWVERSVTYNNGANNNGSAGPVGIWAWDSDRINIQYNESHHNHTNSFADGDGFDLDGGVTNSVMQYNYSHDNDGAGFMLCQYAGAIPPNSNNVIRHNISQNDARRNTIAAIYFWNGGSGIFNAEVYHNTVFVSPSAIGNPRAITLQMAMNNVHVRNNVFITTGGVPMVEAAAGQNGVLFQGNLYWSSGAPLAIWWGGAAFSDLALWRAGTGQELLSGTPVGINLDPRLSGPGLAPTLNNADLLNTIGSYRPQAGSPVIDTGLNLPAWFGVTPGNLDFFGTILPRGAGYDIGAGEY